MEVPAKGHPIWSALIKGEKEMKLSFLAASIYLTRARRNVTNDSSTLSQCIDELRDLYVKNANLPSAKADIAALLQ